MAAKVPKPRKNSLLELDGKLEDEHLRVLMSKIVRILNLKSTNSSWKSWRIKWLGFAIMWFSEIRFLIVLVVFQREPFISLYLGDFFYFFQSGGIRLWIIVVMLLYQLNAANAILLINLSATMRTRILQLADLLSGVISPAQFGFNDLNE